MIIFFGFIVSCDQSPSTVKGVVANVNGVPITQEELAFASRGISAGHQSKQAFTDKAKFLDGIILQELAHQQAVKLGLDADPKYQAELRGLEAQINTFKRKKLSEIFLQRESSNKVRISDAQAQQYFNDNVVRLRSEINVWQILSRNENIMHKIQAEMENGLAFEEVAAKQFPNLQKSDRKPWDLGYLQWNQVPEVWHKVINNMRIGDTSDIIRGENNRYWIIKLIAKRENTDLTFEQVKSKIVEILQNEKNHKMREKAIQSLRDNAQIVYAQ